MRTTVSFPHGNPYVRLCPSGGWNGRIFVDAVDGPSASEHSLRAWGTNKQVRVLIKCKIN